jgi:NAD(P)-dependent dehydrogenase (short-subunit alcohol dehydrogenase family)
MISRTALRVVIVTGAAGDIGFDLSHQLVKNKYLVIMGDKNVVRLRERVADAKIDEQHCAVIELDVSQEASADAAVAYAISRYGRIDALVNNAATVTPTSPVGALSVDLWREAFNVNVTGTWLMCRATIPHMLHPNSGVILNVASQLGHVAAEGRGAYSATKAALHSLTRSLTADYGKQGLRAVSISPGAVLTSRVTARYGSAEKTFEALGDKYPSGRIGTIQDITSVALFLLGDAASFINGTDTLVDGGYTAI